MMFRIAMWLGITPFRLWTYVALALSFLAFCGTIYAKGYLSCSRKEELKNARGIVAEKIADQKLQRKVYTMPLTDLDRAWNSWLRDR